MPFPPHLTRGLPELDQLIKPLYKRLQLVELLNSLRLKLRISS